MLLFAQAQFGMLLCLAALVIAVCFVLMRTRPSLSRNTGDSSVPKAEREKPGHHAGGPNDMLRWEVAMHETARDLSAQLDSKLGILQQLIHEADRAAARLEAALAAAGNPPPGAGPDAAGEPFPASEPRPVSQAEALRNVGGGADAPKPASRGEPAQHSAGGARYQEIYTLADYGYPPSEIAQRLGSPVGEVELILSLRDKR